MKLETQIAQNLGHFFNPRDEITIIDENGDGQHYKIEIVSNLFEGKSRIARHRLVHSQLVGLLSTGQIHAIKLKLKTFKENAKS